MKHKDIRFIIIFVLIISFAFIYLFQSSYAKYRKQINATATSNIAGWNITINNESISNKQTLINNLTPIFIGNENTSADVLAPGIEGYYDIIINSTKVDVNFDYEITSINSINSSISDLKTTSYIINPTVQSEKIDYDTTVGITGTITHNTSKTTIRVYIKWDDSADATMDNEADTNVATNKNSKAEMTVSIKFNQKNNI